MGHRLLLFGRRNIPSPLLSGLAAYWNLNETGGPRADSFGVSNLTDNNTTLSGTGKVGNAAAFVAASSQYLSVASNSAIQVGDFDFTIAGWVNLTTLPVVGACLWSKAATSNIAFVCDFNGATRFRFYVTADGATPAIATANNFGLPSIATWYFVLAYHDSVNNVIGIQVNNGTADTTAHSAGVFVGTAALRIGARGSGGAQDEYMNGLVDEVGFWKRLLTSDEKAQIYNSGNGTTYPFV